LIWERPILGNGLGSFTLVRARITSNPYEAWEAHNDYLRLAIETGLLGILSYVILILSILIKIISLLIYNKKNQPDMYLWIIGLFGLAIGFFAMSISDNILRNTAMQWAFWAYMAGVFAIGKKK